ncbi:amino acid adenylation domain-containing protein [Xanthomonas campestris pv. campestris]|uniref:non-ribosomal peptide synthetase n=1 Tax=Xanthomonas campestris TaxID=339 RepID=UPI001E4AD128|nr:non-ribosomal peptide synthetase [Xanthomonas campestris]MCD0254767.1 amino acid adenylation domain-containing protein [Xanthomonas campestris pv. campestris]MEB1300195.1 non-ribosomal peptide synthetase [Xanthomonas campestris pv. campestris]MEB1334080.1 non-ribosomal peptide synthetase [Xanthomonas campestris pv. campestris]MEB1899968.1 non-ribosomal peptide synthetase [Xanthomonas campestris pv. campestris]WVL70420.1 non-ribosomal peptide synthetase [Xanthomonas campestris pv. campestris
MSDVVRLLADLRARDVRVSLVDAELEIDAPDGALTEDDLQALRAHKPALLEFMAGRGAIGQRLVVPLTRQDQRGMLPVSVVQRRLWFVERLGNGGSAYCMIGRIRLPAALDEAALQCALDAVLARHDALRTHFVEHEGRLCAQVTPPRRFPLQVLDLALESAQREACVQAHIAGQAADPFDLAVQIPVRGHLLKFASGDRELLLTVHHIVCDGGSIERLAGEVAEAYQALHAGHSWTPPPLPLQYADYVRWQQDWMQADEQAPGLAFWRAHLEAAPALLELPSDRPRPPLRDQRGGRVGVAIAPALTEALRRLGERAGTSLFAVLAAAWTSLLARLSGQDEVVLGVPVANRERSEFEPLIGCFVNTIALRLRGAGEDNVGERIAAVRQTLLSAMAHAHVPFEQVVEALNPARSLSHSPVFQTLFGLQAVSPSAAVFERLGWHLGAASNGGAKFDLSLLLQETADGALAGEIEYACDLFDGPTIERWREHFHTLLAGMADGDLARAMDRLPMHSPAQRHQLLEQWNATGRAYPEASVPALFEAQVQRTPDATALCDAGGQWSYAELDARANRLAHYLRAQGVSAGDRVGVCLARDASLVAALLGVLKAGACYVPLDPAYPAQRLDYMLSDAQAQVVLCDARWADSLSAPGRRMCCLDQLGDALAGQPTHALGEAVAADALAYLIYTSGSTGQPKGVAIEHRNVSALLHWAHEAFPVPERACVLASTSVCFDLSAFELYVPLTAGGRVWMVENVLALPHLPADAAVSWVNTVPSAMAELVRQGPLPASVVAVGLAGEPLHGALTQAVYAVGAQSVYNLYGPSEDTTYSTWYRVGREEAGAISIGRPIANTRAYLLDAHGEPVAAGAVGELYLAGAGVARGYLGREALTRERFLADRFGGQGRMYRTGDLARYRADGNLEFLGRADHQVKLRGYRIELGEIEAELRRHAGVKEAAVVLQAQGGGRLLAYVSGMTADDEAALRAHLRARLPDYMVPGHWVWLEALPHTANGKIDRQRLPTPPARARSGGALPQSATERTVAAIWSRLLALPEVALDDGFFESGGHSLLVMQLQGELRQQLQIDVPISAVFEYPTLGAFCDQLEASRDETSPAPRPPGPAPLSHAQESAWYLEQTEDGARANKLSATLRLDAALEPAVLAKALAQLIQRHEILRTSFGLLDGEPVQHVHAPESIASPLRDGPSGRDFDPGRAPLLEVFPGSARDGAPTLEIRAHHLIADGRSLEILQAELGALYLAELQARPALLPALPMQYADYAIAQRAQAASPAGQQRLAQWHAQAPSGPDAFVSDWLPQRSGRTLRGLAGASLRHPLGSGVRERLHASARRAGTTPFVVAMATYALALRHHSRIEDFAIGAPIDARDRPALAGMIGFLVDTLVVRHALAGDPDLGSVLAVTSRAVARARGYADLSLSQRQAAHGAPGSELFRVWLNYYPQAAPAPQTGWTIDTPAADTAKFPLMLTIRESADSCTLELAYDPALLSTARASELLDHLAAAFEAPPSADELAGSASAWIAAAAARAGQQRQAQLSRIALGDRGRLDALRRRRSSPQ